MLLPAHRLEKLRELGLPEYQARAYLTLLEIGPAAAREVATQSGVPRGKVYATLNDLHARGLVDVTPERPHRYVAAPVAELIGLLRRHHREALESLTKHEAALVREFAAMHRGAPPPLGSVTVVRGRRNVVERLRALLAAAEREVFILATGPGLLRLAHEVDEVADAAERGVVVRIRAPVAAANRGAATALAPHADVRPGAPPGGDVSLVVVDGVKGLLHRAVPDDGHVYQGEDLGVVVEDRGLAEALAALAGCFLEDEGIPDAALDLALDAALEETSPQGG